MASPRFQSARPRPSDTFPPADRQEQATGRDPAPLTIGPMSRGPRVLGIERWLARRMLRAIGGPPICLVLWNDEEITASDAPPIARVVFRNRSTFWRVLFNPNLQFGDAYTDGRLEVEGDLVAFLEAVGRARVAALSTSRGLVPAFVLSALHQASDNSLTGARKNIHRHYDVGNEFYKVWLDEQMVYSGAYFPTPTVSLEKAQRAKLNHVCRKLWLRPGESVVEVGGGWGALALLLARDYGVTVKSFNISKSQIEYSRRRAQAEGLDSRVEFIEDDYRNITGRFDALVSLGMLEHVGVRHYREFGCMMHRCLRPDGRGLIQTIGQDFVSKTNTWIDRRIFPGAYPPTLREMADLFEPSHFSILDVENLRLHYAQTLRHWRDRFEASSELVAQRFDRRFVRAWRLYLAGSCAAFASGGLQLFQVVFARPGMNEIPWTRAELYAHAD
jgi:cyclopropane-fatty-acyl-phospholipid synthase